MPWPRFGINFANSEFFKNAVQKSFESVDVDKDGQLDYKELYIGLLKLYDDLNDKLPCHIKIPTNAEVDKMLKKYDKDNSGRLNSEEYLELSKALLGNRKNWRDSIFLKCAFVLGCKIVAFPYLGGLTKRGLSRVGVPYINKLPVPLLCLVMEKVTGKAVPVF
eukprot:CAMPEP_0202892474 /NCGR_PEP_ID=MMETSP1392-20130828/2194_1 /ASSEMBLY_ACC=CAM_ASM_000868 /TAXON_ID=225041 /ORGANISM="Chlamydomonas chlamydogama, Strain SAG 11-48b" /LENGTH=162 /DNA_ID=CAMNT_0049576437 /DNA_START=85 /DNA_END=573 /DNA_ORIENTATION=-